MQWLAISIVWLASACSSSARPWKLHMWNEPPADGSPTPMEVPFGDGQDGTELVMNVLGTAKQIEATGISSFEIQVGGCVREVSVAPRAAVPTQPASRELDRITLQTNERKLVCGQRHVVHDQPIDHRQAAPEMPGGVSEIRTVDECRRIPVERVVTRYRFEIERGFVTPDWQTIAATTGLALRFGPPRCGLAPKNQVRATLHAGASTRGLAAAELSRGTASEIADLGRQAERAARRGDADVASRLADQVIEAWGDGSVLAGLDPKTSANLLHWLAAAHFYRIEPDVAKFLARAAPAAASAAWAAELGAEIDRIAARYTALRDLVRVPAVEHWLRAGAQRLATLHLHAAELLDRVQQSRASQAERTKARELLDASRGAR